MVSSVLGSILEAIAVTLIFMSDALHRHPCPSSIHTSGQTHSVSLSNIGFTLLSALVLDPGNHLETIEMRTTNICISLTAF